ncbi:MAG: DMT family transporter [Gammaproteobacteria bacterium]
MNERDAGTPALLLAVAAGIVLGTAVVVSRYAYDGGASGIVVAIVRSLIMAGGIAAGLALAGVPWRLPRGLLRLAVLNGALMALMTFGNIGAVEFISVGLTSLLFFTFPILIALLVVVLRMEQVRPAKLAAIGLAFSGLTLMLGASLGTADLRGIALALMAALATAVNAIVLVRHFRHTNVFVATLHFSLYGLVVLCLIAALFAEARLPLTASGWAGVVGVGVLQTIGTPMYLYAIARIGALKAGMATNVQPVAAIALAWLLFGELLSVAQAAGGAIVLGAVALMQWLDLRQQRGTHARRP